ncbi:hypothetical protein [Bowmanella dokdonensis]|uniref:Uncharacterized protein n=1 Tax=Bowmanella dokdonensis TaxID=751969 RepID=A0A939DNA5_9ALTE|nr:hypothetical protein [Bowmanella dokdonensis]MBN7825933.1 hypothetical protein [Bowmanella dokdonensis]
MSNWLDAFVFGLALMAFVLGVSSIIMALLHSPVTAGTAMKEKVEYGFFGISGLVLCILFSYAL